MKTSILQENLSTTLQQVSKFISNRPVLPILSNFYFKVEKDRVLIRSTDLDNGMESTIPAQTQEVGEFCVPAKQLTSYIQSLKPGKLQLYAEDQKELVVGIGTSTGRFPLVSSEEFPQFPEMTESEQITLAVDTLTQVENLVLFTASPDTSRPVLSSLLIRLSGKQVSFVATDGFRLSLLTLPHSKLQEPIDLLVPAKAFGEFCRLIKGRKQESLSLMIDKVNKSLKIMFDNNLLFTRLVDGQFPDYQQIIPDKKNLTTIKVSREEFEDAIKRASIFGQSNSSIVSLYLLGDQLRVVSQAEGQGGQESILEISVDTPLEEEIKISFNARFLSDFVSRAKTDMVVLHLASSLSPVLFDGLVDNYLHVIMPIKI